MKKTITSTFLICLFTSFAFAQDVQLGKKLWYSNYTFVKLNSRYSIDNFFVASYDLNKNHRFGFMQTDLGFNYHYSRKLRFFIAYSNSQFRYWKSYLKRYGKEKNSLGMMTFHRVGLGTQYNWRINRNFRFNQKLVAQYYSPKLEKYQFRYMYTGTLVFKHRKMPFRLQPFAQYFLYYYSGGKKFDYTDEETGEIFPESPNGLHRYRVRAGFSFKPIPKFKPLSLKFYYGYQREFNTGFGNDLNIETISSSGKVKTNLKFNNYAMYGVQLNMIFN